MSNWTAATVVTAHCPNPGSMLGGLAEPGLEVWLAPNRSPTAKLRWRWELLKRDGHLIGINTNHPNGIVAEAISAGRIPELAGYDSLRREVKYGQNSRIDILLEAEGRPPAYVEVKNVHLRRRTDRTRRGGVPGFGDRARRQAPGRGSPRWWPAAPAR